jgi:hypothetical protein
VQEEHGQIFLNFRIEGKEFPLFIKLDPQERLLQLLLFLPCALIPTAAGDLARLLLYINKEVDMPGFGMDEGNRIIFYRCTIPTMDGRLDPDVLDNFLYLMPRISHLFLTTIATVAAGLRFESSLPQIQKLLKQLSTPPGAPQ